LACTDLDPPVMFHFGVGLELEVRVSIVWVMMAIWMVQVLAE